MKRNHWLAGPVLMLALAALASGCRHRAGSSWSTPRPGAGRGRPAPAVTVTASSDYATVYPASFAPEPIPEYQAAASRIRLYVGGRLLGLDRRTTGPGAAATGFPQRVGYAYIGPRYVYLDGRPVYYRGYWQGNNGYREYGYGGCGALPPPPGGARRTPRHTSGARSRRTPPGAARRRAAPAPAGTWRGGATTPAPGPRRSRCAVRLLPPRLPPAPAGVAARLRRRRPRLLPPVAASGARLRPLPPAGWRGPAPGGRTRACAHDGPAARWVACSAWSGPAAGGRPAGGNPPPGHGGTPPGHGGLPPGQSPGGTPPGRVPPTGPPPGQAGTPPGHSPGPAGPAGGNAYRPPGPGPGGPGPAMGGGNAYGGGRPAPAPGARHARRQHLRRPPWRRRVPPWAAATRTVRRAPAPVARSRHGRRAPAEHRLARCRSSGAGACALGSGPRSWRPRAW